MDEGNENEPSSKHTNLVSSQLEDASENKTCTNDMENTSGSSSSANKRKRILRTVADTDNSDSDIEIPKRTKPTKLINNSEDSSDSNIVLKNKKGKNKVAIQDEADYVNNSDSNGSDSESDNGFEESSNSDWTSDSEGEDLQEGEGNAEGAEKKKKDEMDASSSSSDSDGESDKCPICLMKFKDQEVGSPESCDHSFCLECIQVWSKNVNTCPVDRQTFNLILVRRNIEGRVVRHIPVEVRREQPEEVLEDDQTFCEVCGRSDREDRMLLCDGCDLGYHLECLDPPLEFIPVEEWYCSDCLNQSDGPMADMVEIYEGELDLLWEDAEATIGRPAHSTRRRPAEQRLVPRTRASERVRATIAIHRNTRGVQHGQDVEDEASSSAPVATGSGSTSGRAAPRNRTATTGTRKAPTTKRKRKKRKTKRKSTTKRIVMYEIDEYGKKFAIKKYKTVSKRRTKRKKKRSVRTRMPKSTKTRLANHLGMVCGSNKVGQLLPEVKKQSCRPGTSSNNITFQRSQAGIPTLHLFGQSNELDYFYGSDSDNDSGGASMGSGGMAVMSARARTRTSTSERQAMRRKGIAASVSSTPGTSSSVPDLLSSILDSQTKFHSKNSVLSLKNDGSIDVQTSGSSGLSRAHLNGLNSAPTRQAPSSSPDADVSTPSSTTPNSVSRSNSSGGSRYQQGDSSGGYSECSGQGQGSRFCASGGGSGGMDGNASEPLDYSSYDPHRREEEEKKAGNGDKKNETDEEIDIYSDIEQGDGDVPDDDVSEVQDLSVSPGLPEARASNPAQQEQDKDSDNDDGLVIDDTVKAEPEKYDPSQAFDDDEEEDSAEKSDLDVAQLVEGGGESPLKDVTSGMVDMAVDKVVTEHLNEVMSAKNNVEDEEEDDDCPNFSIYSTESLSFARNLDIQVNVLNSTENTPEDGPKAADDEQLSREMEEGELQNTLDDDDDVDLISDSAFSRSGEGGDMHSSDLFGESAKKTSSGKANEENEPMTEDISDEERTYTPCLDEKDHLYDDDNEGGAKKGIGGLDTELISDEERNDIFDESHDLKTVSDGDALEINAKESELDFTKPDDYEEGEIVEKAGAIQGQGGSTVMGAPAKKPAQPKGDSAPPKKSKGDKEKGGESGSKKDKRSKGDDKNKENNDKSKNSFKKLSKSNKDRNYRDKEKGRKSRSKSPRDSKKDKENRKERTRKEKRKDLERYDVRSLISDRPKSNKDKFGRDETRNRSPSMSSRSPSVRRSFSPRRRSASRDRGAKRRKRSPRKSRSYSASRSRSRDRRSRSRSSHGGRRRRDRSTSKPSKRKARNRSSPGSGVGGKSGAGAGKRKGSRSRKDSKRRSRSPSLRRRRDWTPSWSRSPSPMHREARERGRNGSPSWTPPLMEKSNVAPHNFTVILPNDSSSKSKKKEKKRKADKKAKEAANGEKQRKRRRSERSPPPSKEVFTSGDNILVSVSFNNENGTSGSKRRRDSGAQEPKRKANREKRKRDGALSTRNRTDMTNLKPVAIIDLEKSPFKELTPSPKDVIVLSDSDHCEKELQKAVCDSSQQDTSYTGPKTPPEPQIKFLIASKQTQMRPIINPLHEPDEGDEEIDPQEELEQRLNDVLHKGPNTPPEPPISAPSSPDVYDPFDPTKSRSPTPTPAAQSEGNLRDGDGKDGAATQKMLEDNSEKQAAPTAGKNDTLENGRSHTPPLTVTEVQAADSQSSGVRVVTPDSAVTGGDGSSTQPSAASAVVTAFSGIVKSSLPSAVIQYSSTSTSLSLSTPALLASVIAPRYNTTPPGLTSTPNRGLAPIKIPLLKSSPIKAAQVKPSPVKSTPVKSAPAKGASSSRKKRAAGNSSNGAEVIELDFESPYSPGSSDYEDLFEPPTESATASAPPPKSSMRKSSGKQKSSNAQAQKNANSSGAGKAPANPFDALFGSSPIFKNASGKKPPSKSPAKKKGASGSKSNSKTQVGVKIDEDNLKILDELPNSAVEMQVKDKFLKKLNRQERVVEEVKLVLKPHYNKKHINKEEYKDILRRSVPKICHNKSGEINPKKIQNLIEAYVRKVRHNKKVTSSSNTVNPQKT